MEEKKREGGEGGEREGGADERAGEGISEIRGAQQSVKQ